MIVDVSEQLIRIVTVAPRDRIDAMSAPDLRKQLQTYLDEGVSHFVIDLATVPFLDSAGMAVLVSVLKRARMAGGDVKLVWPQLEAARRILHLTKFDRVFSMAEGAEQARQSFLAN